MQRFDINVGMGAINVFLSALLIVPISVLNALIMNKNKIVTCKILFFLK